MRKIAARVVWALISLVAAFFLAAIAVDRGEPVNSFWIVLAAACTYLVGFRFYAKFIAAKVMALDDQRATPAERLRDGHDYEPTNKWILFGHHFAAIAGPGPLIGPTLAAQFGYLPSVYWIIIGAVLGGAVQDFVILFCSMRRDGKTLGQMARDEIGKVGGFTALLTVLFIMIILLAVVALVVVNALKGSPWGTFTIAATMPIALFMGVYLRYWRPGKVLECSLVGFVLVMASIFGGQAVANSGTVAPWFTLSAAALAIATIIYGFLSSVLPVWLFLAPRDYLSTFIKLGVVAMLALGILFVHPTLALPAFTRFVEGVSVRLHYHRVRRGVGISRADFFRHHAQNDRARMERLAGGLWVHAAGRLRRHHGADRRVLPAARCFLRGELAARRRGIDTRGSRVYDIELGLSGFGYGHEYAGGRCGRKNAVLSHRRSAVARAWNGAHLHQHRRRPCDFGFLVSLRHHV
jgi:hypothetical protein